ncbi:hypothetical protein RFI_23532 [Reticulomyxa filosa]|uniref:Uncharacterized protein n=1 Tax=Reticulomyxa filosa TaxID=46433 RepID=X6ML89_RETFI|nr:hypothetical protein RFI_23532 [Reticulomyxa filosa]|eukprot:ETO13835.1 hypothetical protein RFI_23532 [Reticulomyxa filosa]
MWDVASGVHFVDPQSSQLLCNDIEHTSDITNVCLNQSGLNDNRKLAWTDNNKDLLICKLDNESTRHKLHTIVNSIAWHPEADILIALCDKSVLMWYYPNIVWSDSDLLKYTCVKTNVRAQVQIVYKKITAYKKKRKDLYLQNSALDADASILHIEKTLLTIRLSSGGEYSVHISPFPLLLYDNINQGKWTESLRLCHMAKDTAMYGAFTGMALESNMLDAVIQGLTALDEPDKLLFFLNVSRMHSSTRKQAEIALYKKKLKEAVDILIENGLLFRAIEFNVRLFRWREALRLAIERNEFIEFVVAKRKLYLQQFRETENLAEFQHPQISNLTINWDNVQSIEEAQAQKERDKLKDSVQNSSELPLFPSLTQLLDVQNQDKNTTD